MNSIISKMYEICKILKIDLTKNRTVKSAQQMVCHSTTIYRLYKRFALQWRSTKRRGSTDEQERTAKQRGSTDEQSGLAANFY